MAMQVNEQSPAVARMAVDWGVIDALLGGTPAMRRAKRLMPQQPREQDADYSYRLSVATLYPALERTLGVMAGKPFSKPVVIGDDVPERIKGLLPDIDNQGASLHVFAAKAFTELMAFGYAGIFVESPKLHDPSATQADAQLQRARPFWVMYRHDAILGLDWEDAEGGRRLSRVRLRETVQEPDGAFGTVEVQQVRVLEPGMWQVWRQAANNRAWAVVDEGTTKLNYIPFVPLIADEKVKGEGRAPLRDLAYLNVKHWQLQSDLDDSLRYAIKPIIAITGMTDTSEQITLQAGGMIKLPAGATISIEQGQAEAVNVGIAAITALEQQMIQTGAELMVAKPGQRTATESNNDAEASKSQLQRSAEDFTDKLALALQYTADQIGEAEGGKVSLYSDYASGSLSDASAQLVKEFAAMGYITKERAIQEMQRRNVLDASFDAATEVGLAREAEPSLGTIGAE